MELQAFSIIQDRLEEELLKQGFSEPQPLEEEGCKAVMFATDAVAYGLVFDNAKQRFELRSTSLNGEGKPGDWRSLSQWLYDSGEGDRAAADSIANDFVDIVQGPKRMAAVQTAKKSRKKGEESNVDAQFFFNRLVGVFPELKEAMNAERIIFGKLRFATMTRAVIVPKCEGLSKTGGESFEKLCTLFNDMYKDGDIEVRGIIIHGIFNALSEEAMAAVIPQFSEELAKVYKCSKKLKEKNIKPEKPKKKNKIVAAALDNANKR